MYQLFFFLFMLDLIAKLFLCNVDSIILTVKKGFHEPHHTNKSKLAAKKPKKLKEFTPKMLTYVEHVNSG